MRHSKQKMFRHEQISLEKKIWHEHTKLQKFENENPGKIEQVIGKIRGQNNNLNMFDQSSKRSINI